MSAAKKKRTYGPTHTGAVFARFAPEGKAEPTAQLLTAPGGKSDLPPIVLPHWQIRVYNVADYLHLPLPCPSLCPASLVPSHHTTRNRTRRHVTPHGTEHCTSRDPTNPTTHVTRKRRQPRPSTSRNPRHYTHDTPAGRTNTSAFRTRDSN